MDHIRDDYSVVATPLYETGYEEGPHQGIVFQDPLHAEILRNRTGYFYNITTEAGCQAGKEHPIIRILNRAGNRSLLNVEILQSRLSHQTGCPVDIVYFENKTFLEQITFMMQTDILLTPHGAQLTSINFMPACGGVLEFFPPGFWYPHFFGPLAASSGLTHGYIYTGVNYYKEWTWGGLRHRWKRFEVRERDVCLPLETSLPFIEQLVDKWRECCRSKKES